MKKLFALLLVLCFTFALGLSASDKSASKEKSTMTGWLVDDKCGAKAAHDGNEACTKKCLEGGAKLAFVSDEKKDVVLVHNPDAVKGHEGHHVKVTGSMMDGQLHVDSVEMASAGEHKH